ncbi:hypothetical protein [Xanthomonas perforans]|nr:hypothetical protein [Xanthomonas perforans]
MSWDSFVGLGLAEHRRDSAIAKRLPMPNREAMIKQGGLAPRTHLFYASAIHLTHQASKAPGCVSAFASPDP